MHGLLAGQHSVHIAADRVDLAVMHDIAVGMGPLPARIGVGGKAGVNHGHGALAVRILEVPIKQTKLMHQEHAFIDDGAA